MELKLDFIKSVLLENGYPFEVIQSSKRAVQLQQKKEPVFGPEKYPVYLKLPYIGKASKRFRIAVQRSVHNGYNNVRAVVIFKPGKCFPIQIKASYPSSLPVM